MYFSFKIIYILGTFVYFLGFDVLQSTWPIYAPIHRLKDVELIPNIYSRVAAFSILGYWTSDSSLRTVRQPAKDLPSPNPSVLGARPWPQAPHQLNTPPHPLPGSKTVSTIHSPSFSLGKMRPLMISILLIFTKILRTIQQDCDSPQAHSEIYLW